MSFVGKKVAESVTDVATGAADVVIGAVGDVAKTATTKVLDVGNEIDKNKIESRKQKSQMAEEKLVKLKSLFDSGILSQQEFESKKSEIISEL